MSIKKLKGLKYKQTNLTKHSHDAVENKREDDIPLARPLLMTMLGVIHPFRRCQDNGCHGNHQRHEEHEKTNVQLGEII